MADRVIGDNKVRDDTYLCPLTINCISFCTDLVSSDHRMFSKGTQRSLEVFTSTVAG